MVTKFAAALFATTLSTGSVHAMTRRSHSPIFQPAQRSWSKQSVYAALRMDHAGLGFVVLDDIAIPSMVRGRSSYVLRRERDEARSPTMEQVLNVGRRDTSEPNAGGQRNCARKLTNHGFDNAL